MARRKNMSFPKITALIAMIAGLIAMIGVGGLFINETFMSVVILKILPLIVHQVIGWVLIVAAILGIIGLFIK